MREFYSLFLSTQPSLSLFFFNILSLYLSLPLAFFLTKMSIFPITNFKLFFRIYYIKKILSYFVYHLLNLMIANLGPLQPETHCLILGSQYPHHLIVIWEFQYPHHLIVIWKYKMSI